MHSAEPAPRSAVTAATPIEEIKPCVSWRWQPSPPARQFRSVWFQPRPRRGTNRSASRLSGTLAGPAIARSIPTNSAWRRPRDAGPIATRIPLMLSRTGRVAATRRAGWIT